MRRGRSTRAVYIPIALSVTNSRERKREREGQKKGPILKPK